MEEGSQGPVMTVRSCAPRPGSRDMGDPMVHGPTEPGKVMVLSNWRRRESDQVAAPRVAIMV